MILKMRLNELFLNFERNKITVDNETDQNDRKNDCFGSAKSSGVTVVDRNIDKLDFYNVAYIIDERRQVKRKSTIRSES